MGTQKQVSNGAPGSGEDPAEAPVLVVEDDRQVRQVLQLALEDEGVVVETAADGQQALTVASAHPPAIIVLDLMLPRKDGVEVAHELRSLCGRDIPIIMITAASQATEKARQMDAVAYFYKPFPLEGVLSCVQYLLQHRH